MEEGLLSELGRSTREEAAVARVCERGEGLGEAVRFGPSRNVGDYSAQLLYLHLHLYDNKMPLTS